MWSRGGGDGNGEVIRDDNLGDGGVEATRANKEDALTWEPDIGTGLVADGLSWFSEGGITVGGLRAVRRFERCGREE